MQICKGERITPIGRRPCGICIAGSTLLSLFEEEGKEKGKREEGEDERV